MGSLVCKKCCCYLETSEEQKRSYCNLHWNEDLLGYDSKDAPEVEELIKDVFGDGFKS